MVRVINNGFKLAALDLDGTLLDAQHQISPENAQAVRQLQAAGAQVVLASGRHYHSMHKYAVALPGMQWVVSCQGGEVADISRQTVLSRTFLPGALAGEVLSLGRSLKFTPVVYTVDDILTDAAWNGQMEFYTELAGHRPQGRNTADLLAQDVFKVIWMGEPECISEVRLPLPQLPAQVEVVRTNARFLEFLPAGVSKGTALATLARHLGISPAEAVVFGDGDNDVPMFAWAGTSVAMPHGWPAALDRATLVASQGPMATALARGVEMVLSRASKMGSQAGILSDRI